MVRGRSDHGIVISMEHFKRMNETDNQFRYLLCLSLRIPGRCFIWLRTGDGVESGGADQRNVTHIDRIQEEEPSGAEWNRQVSRTAEEMDKGKYMYIGKVSRNKERMKKEVRRRERTE